MNFPVVGQFDISRSKEWQTQDTINWFVTFNQNAKTAQSLSPLPGISKLFDINEFEDPIRTNGIYPYGNSYYVISGSIFYKVQNNSKSQIGIINSTNGVISWTDNTTQIVFADGEGLYVYNLTTAVFTQITHFVDTLTLTPGAPLPPSPLSVYFQDARVVVCFSNSNQYFYSSQGDATQYDVNNFIALESQPDTAMAVSGSNERLFLFGKLNTEIWAPNTADTQQPYYRDNNYIYEAGLGARASLVKGLIEYDAPNTPVVNFVFWLTAQKNGVGSFVLSTGGMPQKVSTPAVDLRLSQFSKTDDCYCVPYKEGGHLFIECTFPTEDETLLVDINTGMWYHKERLNGSCSLINSHIWFENKHIVGSRLTPSIYQLSNAFLTDDGEEVKRTRITETLLADDFKRMSGHRFEIDMESGEVQPNISPYVFIYYSIDGGRNWSNPFKIEMGKTGEYRWKTFVEGLSDGYSYTFKIEIYDAVRTYLFGGAFDYTVST